MPRTGPACSLFDYYLFCTVFLAKYLENCHRTRFFKLSEYTPKFTICRIYFFARFFLLGFLSDISTV